MNPSATAEPVPWRSIEPAGASERPVVQVRGLSRTYGSDPPVHALRGVDLEISRGDWLAIVGPLVMTWLLMKVSGVPMLERSLRKKRAGYDDYRNRVSAFLPLPPR